MVRYITPGRIRSLARICVERVSRGFSWKSFKIIPGGIKTENNVGNVHERRLEEVKSLLLKVKLFKIEKMVEEVSRRTLRGL